jgi:ParB/RepB/Spo0J family partition protein
MSKAQAPAGAQPRTAGEVAFDSVLELIKEQDMAEGAAAVAAGLARNVLAQARANGKCLSLPAIEKFAAYFKSTVGELCGEPLSRAHVPDHVLKRLAIPTEQAGSLTMIALSCIRRSNLNPRKTFDEGDIAELANSIAAQGLLQNLVVSRVRDAPAGISDFFIVAGERRWRALTKLQAEGRLPAALADGGIPCRVVEGSRAEHLALAILENLMRKDVNPMEEAEGFAKLQAMDPETYTTAFIASQIGTTQRHIQLRLQLVKDLIPETQAALREGKINMAQARVLTIAPAKKQKDLLKSGAAANYKAEDLKRQITGQWVLCSYARFDWTVPELAEYIVKDGDTEWFKDKKKFDELQAAAVDRLLLEAKAKFVWAEEGYYYSYDYDEHLVSPATRGGCLISISYTGEVTIREGLVLKRKTDHLSAEDLRRRAIVDQLSQERYAAFDALEEQLLAALQPRDAIMLMLFNILSPRYGDGPLQGSLQATPELMSGPLKRLAGSIAKQQQHPYSIAFKDKVDLTTAWTVMDGLKDEELAEAITCALRPAVRLQKHKGLHAAFIAVAARHDIEVPEILLAGEDWKAAEIARRMAEPDAQIDIEDAIAAQGEAA